MKVELRGAQLADPEMGSALSLFRRAANIIARFEDALIFNGPAHCRPAAPGRRHAAMAKIMLAAKTSHGLVDVS